jgi:hypothetical protein
MTASTSLTTEAQAGRISQSSTSEAKFCNFGSHGENSMCYVFIHFPLPFYLCQVISSYRSYILVYYYLFMGQRSMNQISLVSLHIYLYPCLFIKC